jgi:hypothetical protein
MNIPCSNSPFVGMNTYAVLTGKTYSQTHGMPSSWNAKFMECQVHGMLKSGIKIRESGKKS